MRCYTETTSGLMFTSVRPLIDQWPAAGTIATEMIEIAFAVTQYTLYSLVLVGIVAVVTSAARALLRAAGLDLFVGIRRLAPITDYPDDWDRRRRAVLSRDAYRCRNCLATDRELHVHHVVPLSSGGTNRLTNLHTLCGECHAQLHPHMKR